MTAMPLAYDTPEGHRALDCFPIKELSIDTNRASATGVFAAASKDRGGDLLEIAGIKTENHQKNPIVLWLHGFDWGEADARKPIGVTEDPDGNYTVKLLPGEGIALATTYFSQKTLLAAQICALVMEKTIRGQSIGYRELKVERMYEDDRYIGTKLVEVEMIEDSWCPIPMNQDAVRSALGRDWGGKSLHPSIKAALSPYASPTPAWANGFGEKTMQPANPVPAAPIATPPAKTKADEADETDDAEKHGSKACRKAYKAISTARKACVKASEGLDDDSDTKAELDAAGETMSAHLDSIKAHHAKKYKDADPIVDEDTDAEGGDSEEQAKDDEALDDDGKAQLAKLKRLIAHLKHQHRLKKSA